MLAIHPDECIDCGVCEAECPAEAIKPESAELMNWLEINRECSEKWPNITECKDPLPEAEKYDGMEGKYDKFFSENP